MSETFLSISTAQTYLSRWGGYMLLVRDPEQVGFDTLAELAGKGNMIVAIYGLPPGRFRDIDETDVGYVVPNEETLRRLKEANERKRRDVLLQFWVVSESAKEKFHEYTFREL